MGPFTSAALATSATLAVAAMAWRSHGDSNRGLVEALVHNGVVRSHRVRAAMLAVDRGHFVRKGTLAYYDAPQLIGHNATISAPHMHAHCLELLEPVLRPGAKALDIGSGSGYLLATMAWMVAPPPPPAPIVTSSEAPPPPSAASSEGPDGGDVATQPLPPAPAPPRGRVYGVEHIPELVDFSVANLQKDSATAAMLADGTITVSAGDGREGWAAHGPFDAIHVGAAAPSIPAALLAQLAPGGRLIVPVGTDMQVLTAYDKDTAGRVTESRLMGVQYVPLTEKTRQEHSGPRTFLA